MFKVFSCSEGSALVFFNIFNWCLFLVFSRAEPDPKELHGNSADKHVCMAENTSQIAAECNLDWLKLHGITGLEGQNPC